MFLKISQYSQENTCVGVSLACNFLKRKLQQCFFVNIDKFFGTAFLYKTCPMAAKNTIQILFRGSICSWKYAWMKFFGKIFFYIFATKVGIASMLLTWFRIECIEYFENTFFWDISLTFKCSKLTIETL